MRLKSKLLPVPVTVPFRYLKRLSPQLQMGDFFFLHLPTEAKLNVKWK